jgi:pimeloyl-ACP methyl ester carboxylesterase
MKRIKDRTVDGAAPLIVLPGTVCDERLYQPVIDRLHHPGEILFAPLDVGRSMAEAAAVFLARAPSRFLLVGFSLGGIASFEIIAQAPERVAGLCLIDTTPRPDPPANGPLRDAVRAKARRDGMEGYITDAWPRLVAGANLENHALRRTIIDMAVDCGVGLLDVQTDMAIHRADSRPRLGVIACPTMVLAGAEEQVCPIDAHREIADGVAGAAFHLIEGAGHFSPLENPRAVASHVQHWLDACTA